MWSFHIICSFFYLLQQLYFESLGIIKPSSLIIISAKEINSGEQGNSTFCKPHNLVPRVLNEFHIILHFVTAVTCGSFLGTQLQQNNTPAVSVDTAVKAKPKRISVRVFHVNLFPTSLIISPKLEISRNLSGRKEAKG